MNTDSLCFRLTVGRMKWKIIAGQGMEDWVEEFARILELKEWKESEGNEGKASRLAVLLQDRSAPLDIPASFFRSSGGRSLPASGWKPTVLSKVRLWFHPRLPDVILVMPETAAEEVQVMQMINACFPIYVRLIESGGLPLHAALVERSGGAVALAAPGGQGKSTCSQRIPPPWRPLGDDLTLVASSRPGEFRAQPFATWNDYLWKRSRNTWPAEYQIRLRAVFFIEQASGDEVLSMEPHEAALRINRSVNEYLGPMLRELDPGEARNLRLRLFDNVCGLARSLPSYILEVSLSGEFWREMEKALPS